MADKARHAYGSRKNLEQALASGTIDSFDVLFLSGEGETPAIGWVDKDGNPIIVESGGSGVLDDEIVRVTELPTTDGDEDVIYIYNNEAYVWDGTKCVPISKSADLSGLENQVAKLETTIDTVEATLSERLSKVDSYEISHKPDGTIVDYRDKEIRVMCPADTRWVLQQSGENADKNSYYIGFKAYAPNEDVVSFKEDLAKTISDDTMYYFENNDFAGIDADGRKYSICWLPVAVYDGVSDTWTYYGANSADGHYVGFYYAVEWYNADGEVIASDCIRINLSNEECHSSIEPYYVNEAVKTANTYTDAKIAEVSGIEVIEF